MSKNPGSSIDLAIFSDDPRSIQAWYDQHVFGRVSSTWGFLRDSAASNAANAAEKLSGLHEHWRKRLATGRPAPELELELLFSYRLSASGALLATIVLAATAVEAFTRLIAEIKLWQQEKGLEVLQHDLKRFDDLPARERVDRALQLLGVPPLPGNAATEIDALVQYRNSILHPAPIVHGPAFTQASSKRGRAVNRDLARQGPYPELFGELFPLALRHALRAIQAHDGLVRHVVESKSALSGELHSRILGSIAAIQELSIIDWADIEVASDAWDEVSTWLESITNADREKWYGDTQRMRNLKKVD